MKNRADKLIDFYLNLNLQLTESLSIEVLNPYLRDDVKEICKQFYQKFYRDNESRILLLGINPGRFGAGVTGISFTDPLLLNENLGIDNNFEQKPELSATFIHQAINYFGGPTKFYSKFHLSAICPLGFVKDGGNINYYDEKELLAATRPFIIETIQEQIDIVGNNKICVCIGKGKNLDFMLKLNKERSFFKTIEVLPHPRWILQYRRKSTDLYLEEYRKVLSRL